MTTHLKNWLLFLSLLFYNNATAQDRNSIWVFGDSAGIDFSNVANPVPFLSNCNSDGSSASIADSAGNLLFYTAASPDYLSVPLFGYNGVIYNKQFQQMDNGDSIISIPRLNGTMIIPNPAANNQYYVFNVLTNSNSYPFHGNFYSLVDLNYNNGLGKVIKKNVPLNSFTYAIDAIGAVKHGNGRDWWVVFKPLYLDAIGNHVPSDTFYVYLVTPDSIHQPLIQPIGNDSTGSLANFTFSPDGSKFATVCHTGKIETFSFNRCTGQLSDPVLVYNVFFTINYNNLFSGCAFSPDGNLLYVTQGTYLPPYYILQVNLSNNNIDTIAQVTSFNTQFTRGTGTLRLGPDNRIYIATITRDSTGGIWYPYPNYFYSPDNMYIATVDSPNIIGSGCSYNPYSFYLGGARCYFGLPNNPDYELGALQGSGCDTLTALKQDPEIAKNNLFVYPNPAKDFVFIRCKGKTKVELRNIAGVVLQKHEFDYNYDEEVLLSLSLINLAQGVYQVKAVTETEEKSTKLIILK